MNTCEDVMREFPAYNVYRGPGDLWHAMHQGDDVVVRHRAGHTLSASATSAERLAAEIEALERGWLLRCGATALPDAH